jgi:3-dehydroquinate synthase
LRHLLSDANLPVVLPADMSADQFLELMSLDKKVIDGKLRLVLLESIGRAVVTDQAPLSQVVQAIESCSE